MEINLAATIKRVDNRILKVKDLRDFPKISTSMIDVKKCDGYFEFRLTNSPATLPTPAGE